MTLEENTANYVIRAYSNNSVTINDTVYRHSIILGPQEIIRWRPTTLSELDTLDWTPVIAFAPALVLLGTGLSHLFPEPSFLIPLYAANIGIEVMSTPAACRTYNILSSDHRRVVAALMITEDHV